MRCSACLEAMRRPVVRFEGRHICRGCAVWLRRRLPPKRRRAVRRVIRDAILEADRIEGR